MEMLLFNDSSRKVELKMNEKGYTLIEILIVVAIIGILVTGAIPALLRARMSVHEMTAQANLKTILTAQTDYYNNSKPHTYAIDMNFLVTGYHAGGVAYLPDGTLADGVKSGYTYYLEPTYTVSDGSCQQFYITAWPLFYQSTGIRSFFIDQTGVIRGQDIGGLLGTESMMALR